MRAAIITSLFVFVNFGSWAFSQEKLQETKLLTGKEDLAAKMVQGIGKWLDGELEIKEKARNEYFLKSLANSDAIPEFKKEMIQKIKGYFGIPTPGFTQQMDLTGSIESPALVSENQDFKVYSVKWQASAGLTGEGLLVEPKSTVLSQVVFIPAPGESPEAALGWGVDQHAPKQAQGLAIRGCRVIIPTVIDRKEGFGNSEPLNRMTNIPRREFVYRMNYEMGAQINGIEVLKALAAVDWLAKKYPRLPIGIGGNSDGAWQALIAAVLDDRIKSVFVQGFFGPQSSMWEQPIDRNTWNYLKFFSLPELISLVKGTTVVDMSRYPEYAGPNKIGNLAQAAPGRLNLFSMNQISLEKDRANALAKISGAKIIWVGVKEAADDPDSGLNIFLQTLIIDKPSRPLGFPKAPGEIEKMSSTRQQKQFLEMVQFCQTLWRNSERTRLSTLANTDTSTPAGWEKSVGKVRDYFWEDVIGKLPSANVPLNPQSRVIYSDPAFTGFEITLNLYPEVFSHGILLLPKDLKPGEKRPVIVCQHGLEGRPTDVCDPVKKTQYYNSFGAQLARLGYIVFAPQNPYIGRDAFRSLQRKANPLGLSLFSFIVRQHEIILQWLNSQPWTAEGKIAFYGLSYGGKTAMRVPSILTGYCLSICSGDFNEWIGKNVLVDYPGSYMWTIEYEMYEFNLGNTFNYAEMAYLIAPRPFMVERGHSDGVGIDEMVSWEFSKVRRFYSRMGIGHRTEIEYFLGGHEINGKGTFEFLKKHLGWPQ